MEEPLGAQGKEGIQDAEVLRFMPGVRALILRMTRDLSTASDLTQEVMMAVIVAVREGRIQHPEAHKAYVHQSARHFVYASQRKMQPTTAADLPEDDALWQSAPRTPLEFCEAAELRRMALDVLDELPADRDRALILGFYVDGKSKRELMDELKLEADHFDRVIFRARSRMRERIRAKMNERQATW